MPVQTIHVVVDFKECRQPRKTFLEMSELSGKCYNCCIFMLSMSLLYVLHDRATFLESNCVQLSSATFFWLGCC